MNAKELRRLGDELVDVGNEILTLRERLEVLQGTVHRITKTVLAIAEAERKK
jgi:hypothetical protein